MKRETDEEKDVPDDGSAFTEVNQLIERSDTYGKCKVLQLKWTTWKKQF